MTRRTKVLTGTAVVLLVLGGAVRIVPQLLWGDGKDWSRVHSIREDRVFQDAANDLVVPTLGVFEQNGSAYFPIASQGLLQFGKAKNVTHTTFFSDPDAQRAILQWLI